MSNWKLGQVGQCYSQWAVIEASITFGGENSAGYISRPETWSSDRQTFMSAQVDSHVTEVRNLNLL
jgi:hypothetical protein